MRATSEAIEQGAATAPYPAARVEPGTAREANGITSKLVLLYVERERGPEAVTAVLRRAGLERKRESLLNENYWFSYEEKIALFEATTVVLNDPRALYKIGEVAIEMNVGDGLKLALRALGSPRLIYQNVVRANAKFAGSHSMELLELGSNSATLRFADVTEQRRYHPLDCLYTRGLLSCVPRFFGGPPARIAHDHCGCDGADACIYELDWEDGTNDARLAMISGGAGAAALGATALAAPALLPLAGGLAATLVGWNVLRLIHRYRARIELLERELSETSRVSERLSWTLQELVSDLRLDEVLAKVTRSAQAALPGREFALLVGEGAEIRCDRATEVPDPARGRIVRWAGSIRVDGLEPVVVEDVCALPELAPLEAEAEGSFRSICAMPLVFREKRLGILVALAPGARSFLPHDLDVIRTYAAQAAIAIANGRLYETLEDLASRDHLTGLLNHREFHEQMEAELERCRRYGGEFSVVLLDLDRFKQINDAHGHTHGDRVLSQVGGALTSVCRSSDSAFRIGGDEFALLLPSTGESEAEVVAERARRQIGSVRRDLDVAYGITVWPADAESKDTLLERADSRLYGMKRGDPLGLRRDCAASPPARRRTR